MDTVFGVIRQFPGGTHLVAIFPTRQAATAYATRRTATYGQLDPQTPIVWTVQDLPFGLLRQPIGHTS